jgi:hypothetical protein
MTFTGQQVIDAFTTVHGTPAKIVPATEQEYQKMLSSGGMMLTAALYRRQWAKGDFGWQGERVGEEWCEHDGMKQDDLVGLVRKYKEEGMSVMGRYWFLVKMVMGW